ncbi:hypothetical protein D3C78_769640 [compost metagenome]
MTQQNVPFNGCPQITEDISHGSLQSVYVRTPGQRRHFPAARSAASGIQPGEVDVGLPRSLGTGTVWANVNVRVRRQIP